MKRLRVGAITLGIVVGSFFLVCFIGDTWEFRATAWPLNRRDSTMLLAGPVTIFLATIIGLKHERWAGYLLAGSGIINAVLFAQRNLIAALLLLTVPTLVAAWMWLRCAPPRSTDALAKAL